MRDGNEETENINKTNSVNNKVLRFIVFVHWFWQFHKNVNCQKSQLKTNKLKHIEIIRRNRFNVIF